MSWAKAVRGQKKSQPSYTAKEGCGLVRASWNQSSMNRMAKAVRRDKHKREVKNWKNVHIQFVLKHIYNQVTDGHRGKTI